MLIENAFVVEAPVDDVWAYVLDVEQVAPCMPGAQLTEVVDDTTWKGKVAVKLGPVSMSFAGQVKMQERDDAAHRVVLKADGREQRGRGAASAVVTSTLEAVDERTTKVSYASDIIITGAAAQYGRGMIQDISARLTKDFATCLQTNISLKAEATQAAAAAQAAPESADATAAGTTSPTASAPDVRYVTAKPVKGLRLGSWAFWNAIVRFFKRLFGGRKT
jgi:carbon monoxide dehydrogenase subunit G